MNYQEKYEQLLAEFKQYQAESIKWTAEDFIHFEDDYDITWEQAQDALEEMIRKHDAEYGITWHTVEYYKQLYGTPKNNKHNAD